MWFYKKYSKIILSMFFSFIIVLFIVPYFLTPGKLTRIIENIFNSPNNIAIKQYNNNNSFILPTVQPQPTKGLINQTPTIDDVREIPNQIIPRFSPTPTVRLNLIPSDSIQFHPSPTKSPKPTRPPDVFPIDPSLARYGKTTDEVFTYASQKTCVPVAVLKGIAYIESGGFFDVVDPKYFLLYNSENWWNSQYLPEEKRACGGYDYDNGSGIVPTDSKFAGHNCHSDGSTGPQSYIMGPMQVNGSEQTQFASQVKSAVGGGSKKIDRRIILDAILIVGFITKQNIRPTSCTNWSGHDIVKAACGYYGSCGIKDGTYYCATFCRNYKKFGGKGSCDAGSFGDNCWQ